MAAGEPAANVIDDALLDGYAVADPVSECLGRCRACGDPGTTELGVWFAGDHPLRDVARLGRAL